MKIITILINILNLIGCKSSSVPPRISHLNLSQSHGCSNNSWNGMFQDLMRLNPERKQVISQSSIPRQMEKHIGGAIGTKSLSIPYVKSIEFHTDYISSSLRKAKASYLYSNEEVTHQTSKIESCQNEAIEYVHPKTKYPVLPTFFRGVEDYPNIHDTFRQYRNDMDNLAAALEDLDSSYLRRHSTTARFNHFGLRWQDFVALFTCFAWLTVFIFLLVIYSPFYWKKKRCRSDTSEKSKSPVPVSVCPVFSESTTQLTWLLVMAIFFAMNNGGEAAVHLQTDDIARNDSGLTWHHTLPALQQFTFCVRLYSYRSRYSDYFFSYATGDSDNELAFHIKYGIKELRMACCAKRIFHIIDLDLKPLKWFYFCAAVDLKTLNVTFVHSFGTSEGILADSRKGLNDPLFINEGGIIILGQDQDEPGGGTDREQSFNGIISDLILTRGLATREEMSEYINCNDSPIRNKSPLIDFDNISQDFKLGAYTEEMNNFSSCPPNNKIFGIFPEPRNFKEAGQFCSTLNGEMALPMSKEDNVMLYNEGSTYVDKCSAYEKSSGVWVGVSWDEDRRIWKNIFTNEESNFKNFEVQISPKAEDPLCVIAQTYTESLDIRKDGNWDIELCERSVCTACQFDDSKPLKIRGLCEESIFDRLYYVYDRINERPVFNGMSWTKIAWNNSQSAYDYTWTMYQIAEPHVKARMQRKSELEYPIGVHEFEVVGDKCPGKLIKLKLTSCPAGMYTCSDGSCIAIDKRCDLELDCPNREDELGCKTVILPPGYDKRIPPPKIDSATPAQISIDFIIRLIRTFSLLDSHLVVDFLITRSWYDSRLQYKNLHDSKNLNLIDDIVDVIWYPDVTLLGADKSIATFDILSTTGWGQRLTEPEPDDDKRLDEDVFYSGSGNLLMLEREITVNLMCTFDLTMYPFDSQRCPLIIYVGDYTQHYVSTVLSKVEFIGTRRLLEYLVTSVNHESLIYQNKSGQQIEIVLTNLYGYYISGAYIPTLLLVIISYSTFYFSLEDFTNRIMVSLTSLLVLASLFSQIASGLPKTAYMKLIDVWFIFCILADFVMVMLLVIINTIVDKQRTRTPVLQVLSTNGVSEKVPVMKNMTTFRTDPKLFNRIAQTFLPIALGLFIITYTGIVTYNLNSVEHNL